MVMFSFAFSFILGGGGGVVGVTKLFRHAFGLESYLLA